MKSEKKPWTEGSFIQLPKAGPWLSVKGALGFNSALSWDPKRAPH